MKIKTFIVSNMDTNGYVAFDENNLEGIVIDPGDEAKKFIDFIKKENIKLKYIILTHAHFDHIGGVDEIKKEFGAEIAMCEGEEIVSEKPDINLSKMFHKPLNIKADKLFCDGDTFSFGDITAKVIKTPGHTPGGCCYYFENEKVLFSGDTLFYGSIGRTDFPYGDFSALISGVREKIMRLPDETIVYCGHGPKTEIGFERNNNPYVYGYI